MKCRSKRNRVCRRRERRTLPIEVEVKGEVEGCLRGKKVGNEYAHMEHVWVQRTHESKGDSEVVVGAQGSVVCFVGDKGKEE